MDIGRNIRQLQSEIPQQVKIIAVSKRQPLEHVRAAYDAGHRLFGENRVQELLEKKPRLPEDIAWQMVGHLQTNKVKFIAGFVDRIHSVDSMKLLRVINAEAIKAGRMIPCLLQARIAREETKYGLTEEQLFSLLDDPDFKSFTHIRIEGLMGMATFTEDLVQVRNEFKTLHKLFDRINKTYFASSTTFREISMGMSGDYQIAIEEGSTMIRVGTKIFGPRT